MNLGLIAYWTSHIAAGIGLTFFFCLIFLGT